MACEQAPKFPSDKIKIYVPLTEFDTCVEYKVIKTDPIQIEQTGLRFPLAHCNKIYGLLPEHQILMNYWIEDMRDYFKRTCNK